MEHANEIRMLIKCMHFLSCFLFYFCIIGPIMNIIILLFFHSPSFFIICFVSYSYFSIICAHHDLFRPTWVDSALQNQTSNFLARVWMSFERQKHCILFVFSLSPLSLLQCSFNSPCKETDLSN